VQEATYSVLCLPLLSGFADTDLDLQLKKHGIHNLIVTDLIAHTCVEATVRLPPSSATTSQWSSTRRRTTRIKRCKPQLKVNIPNYASAIVTADAIIMAISFPAGIEVTARS
jgi:ureidoacrylate peracid hydrolase